MKKWWLTGGVIILSAALSPVVAKPIEPSYSWTGFYLFGGGGYGFWSAEQQTVNFAGAERSHGDGWFGTVGGGYDWQFASSWVAGVFADAQFGRIKGAILAPFQQYSGSTKNDLNFAGGLRAGFLVSPETMVFANGGYSHAHFTGSHWFDTWLVPLGVKELQRDGWFIGGGIESSLGVLGVAAPGWSAKIEYRFAEYGRKNADWVYESTGLPYPGATSFDVAVQTVSASLVYRFR